MLQPMQRNLFRLNDMPMQQTGNSYNVYPLICTYPPGPVNVDTDGRVSIRCSRFSAVVQDFLASQKLEVGTQDEVREVR
jgi:hypothetical protein